MAPVGREASATTMVMTEVRPACHGKALPVDPFTMEATKFINLKPEAKARALLRPEGL